MVDIPRGCTHVELANPLSYCQRPTFMRFAHDFTGPESGTRYYCFYIWHHYKHYSDWVKDLGYQKPKDESRFVTIDEYQKMLQS